MMWKSIPSSEGSALNDEDEDGDDDFAAKSGSRREVTALIDDPNWKAVAEAVDKVGQWVCGIGCEIAPNLTLFVNIPPLRGETGQRFSSA